MASRRLSNTTNETITEPLILIRFHNRTCYVMLLIFVSLVLEHGYWEWAQWMQWDPCSKTCENGVQKKIRYNTCVEPKYGGKPCPENVTKSHSEDRGCNINVPCPGM